MIQLVTGPPGNGKSYYAIRAVAKALRAGKVVAGNVELRKDWSRYMANRDFALWLKPWARKRWLEQAEHRLHVSDDLDELFAIRLKGTGEGRGLMVLDEAHQWMNSRSWSSGDRSKIVRFFSQHRKIGWDVLLIAQDGEMIDKQVRTLFEYHVHLRNLRRARFFGVPLSPVNLFLAITVWHAAQRSVVRRELFPLWWFKNLYDTTATFGGLDADGGAIWLPSPPTERQRARPDSPPLGGGPDAGANGRTAPKEAVTRLLDAVDPADLDP